jgi:hypothetical protein
MSPFDRAPRFLLDLIMRAFMLRRASLPSAVMLLAALSSAGRARAAMPDSVWTLSATAHVPSISNAALDRTAPDALGGWFAMLPESSGVRVQRFGAMTAVDPKWPASGVALSFSAALRIDVALVADDATALLAMWTEPRDSSGVGLYAQHLFVDGSRDAAWPVEGMPICGRHVREAEESRVRFARPSIAAISDSAGGAFVAWSDTRADDGDIYVQHVLPDGALPAGWAPEGVRACAAPGLQRHCALLGDGTDGVFVAWEDARAGGGSGVFVQHLGVDGGPLPGWPDDGIPVHAASQVAQSAPQLTSDGLGGAIVTWSERREAGSVSMAAHFAGQPELPRGITLRSADARATGVRIRWEGTAVRGHELVVERSEEGGRWQETARVRGDLQGVVSFDDTGVHAGRHYEYRISRESADGFVISGSTLVDVPRQARFALEPIAADTSVDRIEVSFGLPNPSPATLALLDDGGRVVESLDVGALGAGNHVLAVIAARTLPSGPYTMRLEQSGRLALQRTHLRHSPSRVRRSRRG